MSDSDFINLVNDCIKRDKKICEYMNELLEEVRNYHTTCNAIKTGGTIASCTGAGFAVASLMAAPLTGGVSLLPAVTGVVLSVAGGTTNAITDVCETNKTNSIITSIQNTLGRKQRKDEDLQEEIRNLQNAYEYFQSQGLSGEQSLTLVLEGVANNYIRLGSNQKLSVYKTLAFSVVALREAEEITFKLLPKLNIISPSQLGFLCRFLGISTKTGAGVAKTGTRLFGVVASVGFAILDVAILVRDWMSDPPSEDTICGVRRQLREEIKKLEELSDILESLQVKVYCDQVLDYIVVSSNKEFIYEFYDKCHEQEESFQEFIENTDFTDSDLEVIFEEFEKKYCKKSNIKIAILNGKLREMEKKPPKEKKHKKRGDHVINNGVLSVYKDILEEFLWKISRGRITINDLSEETNKDLERNISEENKTNIESVMIAKNIPILYFDLNALWYGINIRILKDCSVKHMVELYNMYDSYPSNSGSHYTKSIKTSVKCINDYSIFVDYVALHYWLAEGGRELTFKMAENEVKTMFHKLYDKLRDWVHDVKRYENNMY